MTSPVEQPGSSFLRKPRSDDGNQVKDWSMAYRSSFIQGHFSFFPGEELSVMSDKNTTSAEKKDVPNPSSPPPKMMFSMEQTSVELVPILPQDFKLC